MILYLYSELSKIISEGFQNEEKKLWIDLDKGQLEDPESFESLIVPAVLINLQKGIDWKQLGQRNEIGDATFSIKIVMMLSEPTFNIQGVNINLTKLVLEDKIHTIISNQKIMRNGTRAYSVGTYYVVEHRYVMSVDYVPISTTKPLSDLSLELNHSVKK